MKGTLDFGGFYGSLHSELIEEMLNRYFDFEIDDDKVNYKMLNFDYSKQWLEYFNDWLISEYEANLKLELLEIISPKEYNFATDVLLVEYKKKDLQKLINDDVISFINKRSKSYDGFISYYEGYNEVKKDLEILFQYVMLYYIEMYNDEQYMNDYFDNNGDDLIYKDNYLN